MHIRNRCDSYETAKITRDGRACRSRARVWFLESQVRIPRRDFTNCMTHIIVEYKLKSIRLFHTIFHLTFLYLRRSRQYEQWTRSYVDCEVGLIDLSQSNLSSSAFNGVFQFVSFLFVRFIIRLLATRYFFQYLFHDLIKTTRRAQETNIAFKDFPCKASIFFIFSLSVRQSPFFHFLTVFYNLQYLKAKFLIINF